MTTTYSILGFEDEFHFLSNFHYATFEYNGLEWRTSEHAYQAAKCEHPEDKLLFTNPQLSPSGAKRLGKTVERRGDWDESKPHIMYEILTAKFTKNKKMREMLLLTEDAFIEETNYWGDTYWGVCKGEGYNMLGLLLMQVREDLIHESK